MGFDRQLIDRRARRVAPKDSRLCPPSGNPDAPVILMGYMPLPAEAVVALDKVLENMKVPPQALWRSTVVKRAVSDGEVPTLEELGRWVALARWEIESIMPRTVVCLGGHAAAAILGFHPDDVAGMRHQRYNIRKIGAAVFVTHPFEAAFANLGDTLVEFSLDLAAIFSTSVQSFGGPHVVDWKKAKKNA